MKRSKLIGSLFAGAAAFYLLATYGCSAASYGMLCLFAEGCGNITLVAAKTAEINKQIATELAPGASMDDVETFFRRHEIDFSYDPFLPGYQGLVRINNSTAVTVSVRLGDDKKFLSGEANTSFTGL